MKTFKIMNKNLKAWRYLAGFAAGLLLACSCAAAATADIYMATNGNDAWSGTLSAPNVDNTDGPCATLHGAKLKIRALLAAPGGKARNWTVMIRGGTYALSAPEVFTLADKAGTNYTVTYESYTGEAAVISGGTVLTGFTVQSNGSWTLTIPGVAAGTWYFGEIWVNGQLARWPIRPLPGGDRFHVAAKVASSGSAANDAFVPPFWGTQAQKLANSTAAPPSNTDRFGFNAGEINSAWTNPTDIRVRLSDANTGASLFAIKSIDMVNQIVTMNEHTLESTLPVGMPWRRENVFEDLGTDSQVGEMYLNRTTGVLTYVPRPGETPANSTVMAPVANQLILISNGSAYGTTGSLVGNLTFENLTFAYTGSYSLVTGLVGTIENCITDPYYAITAIGASNVTVDHCTFRNLGDAAIGFGPGSTGNTATANLIYDIGSNGIFAADDLQYQWYNNSSGGFNSGGGAPTTPLVGANNMVITNNSIHDYGKVINSSSGIYLGEGANNTISHNEVYNGPCWGIMVQNVYVANSIVVDPKEHDNYIGYNHVHEMGWDNGRGAALVCDFGGLYLNLRGTNTTVEYNKIHDVHTLYPIYYGGALQTYAGDNNGLYVDGDSSYLKIQNNLIYNAENTLLVLKGSGHSLSNNIFYGQFQTGMPFGNSGGGCARVIWNYPWGDGSLTPTNIVPAMNFQHNIVAYDVSTTAWPINGWLWNQGSSPNVGLSSKPLISENNLYYQYGATISKYTSDLNWSGWKTAGHDTNSVVNQDPLFTNPSASDFSLQPGSPASGIGFIPIDLSIVGPVGLVGVPPAFLPPMLNGGQIILNWTGSGQLLWSTNLVGPWATNTTATAPPYSEAIMPGQNCFYRLQAQ
jgi:hypothetical protein